jgi:hypothetical protein
VIENWQPEEPGDSARMDPPWTVLLGVVLLIRRELPRGNEIAPLIEISLAPKLRVGCLETIEVAARPPRDWWASNTRPEIAARRAVRCFAERVEASPNPSGRQPAV